MIQASQLRFIIAVLAGLAMLFFSLDAEAQCAMCKASIESSVKEGEASVGAGINNGILYIMGIPYLLIAAAGFFIYKHNKKLMRVDR